MADSSDLRRATRLAPLVSPDRVRLAREIHGWTQGELVRAANHAVSAAAISQLETGKTRPTGPTLAAIAGATGYPLEYFVRHAGDTEVTGFFRSLRSAPARERRRALAWAHLLHDLASALSPHVRLPDVAIPRYDAESHSPEDIDEIATEVRDDWDLGDGPIDNVVLELERHGCLVARLPLARHDLDAFSVWFPDRPIVVLGRDKEVAARSRFDAAHELGHLILHPPEVAGTKQAEQEAHRFAAALLLPESSLRDELPATPDWRQLLRLKAEWGVSLQALLMRAKTLGVMSEYRYVSALKQMSARGWRRAEPGDSDLGPPEQPRLLENAIRHVERQGVTLDELANAAGLPTAHIERLLDVARDTRPHVDI